MLNVIRMMFYYILFNFFFFFSIFVVVVVVLLSKELTGNSKSVLVDAFNYCMKQF